MKGPFTDSNSPKEPFTDSNSLKEPRTDPSTPAKDHSRTPAHP